LAIIQAEKVKSLLADAHPGLHCQIVEIATSGDKNHKSPLAQIGGVGVFIKELENALIAGKIDIAVHCAKDLPTMLNPQFAIGAYPEREAPEDAWVSLSGFRSRELPAGFRVASSSPRRRAMLKYYRPDLELFEVRGNIDTRLKKLHKGEFDATILAVAGLKRLGYDREITQILSAEEFVPAVGQGAIAVEILSQNSWAREVVQAIDKQEVRNCLEGERAFLRKMNAGCSSAIGGLCQTDEDRLLFTGAWLDLEGKRMVKVDFALNIDSDYIAVGEWAGEKLLNKIQS
jgi:hydroxymethylbilane synthase